MTASEPFSSLDEHAHGDRVWGPGNWVICDRQDCVAYDKSGRALTPIMHSKAYHNAP